MRVIGFICLAPWLAGCLATPPQAVAPTPVAVPVLAYPAPDRLAAPSAAKHRPPKPASKSTAPKSRAPQIAAVIAPPPPKPARLMGLGATEVSKLLGVPARVRRERRVRIWQYVTGDCVLDLFLYPAAGVYRHILSRARRVGAGWQQRPVAGVVAGAEPFRRVLSLNRQRSSTEHSGQAGLRALQM